jgi:hypothetical protein
MTIPRLRPCSAAFGVLQGATPGAMNALPASRARAQVQSEGRMSSTFALFHVLLKKPDSYRFDK